MAQSNKDEVKRRINRIKGQVEGIQRMMELPKSVLEIFNQITAAKKALDSLGRNILETHIRENLRKVSQTKEEENKVKEIIELMEKF